VQAPFEHVDPVHAVPVFHCPFDWHVCTLLPEHCVAFGVHTPPHAPEVHTYWQALAVPQVPLAVQASTPLPEHVVWLGAHTPVQAPLTHVWFVHAAAVLH
jgi:hypothetical protein